MIDANEVIQCAAQLVDGPDDCDDEYRAGVVALATLLCFPEITPQGLVVMGYAVHGVNRPPGGLPR